MCRVVFLAFVSLVTECVAVDSSSWKCTAKDGTNATELLVLAKGNCHNVAMAIADFRKAFQEGGDLRNESELLEAERLCADVKTAQTVTQSQANDALTAWGLYMTNGRECCNNVSFPYCTYSNTWWYNLVVLLLLSLVVGLILASSIFMALRTPAAVVQRAPLKEIPESVSSVVDEAPPVAVLADRLSRTPVSAQHGQSRLEEVWLRRSPLRVLPNAMEFAAASSSVFSGLHAVFDFQWDNVQNQFEHLLSAWRSQCAMVADRSIDKEEPVKEDKLLQEALGDLHADLLEGFRGWRKGHEEFCRTASGAIDDSSASRALPVLGGATWTALKPCDTNTMSSDECTEMNRQLAEIAAYLLVWGECGNLRFMPEMVYLITHFVLIAEAAPSHVPVDEPPASFRSSMFLAQVVRPVYKVIFDEWYDQVELDGNLALPAEQRSHFKDKKALRPGFETFLPADVANYDDWNELFCHHAQLQDRLVLNDGSMLFALPPEQRYSALSKMDWERTLKASNTKTHREIHSLWGVFAATHRIWLLHVLLFLVTACCISQVPVEQVLGNSISLRVPTGVARFSTMCLIVPIHGLMWFFARWQVTGYAFRSFFCELCCCSRSLYWNLLYAAPVASYVCICLLVNDGRDNSGVFYVAVFSHYALSCAGLFGLLFFPSSEDRLWPLTQVSFQKRFVRYLFWILVLATKFTFGWFAMKGLADGIVRLQYTIPGFETPKDLFFMYSPFVDGSNTPVLLLASMWLVSFLLYLVDTQLWFVVGCSFLGVIVYFAQRGCRVGKIVFEDAVAKIPERFSKQVFKYTKRSEELRAQDRKKPISEWFPYVWDRIVEYMRYEDDIDYEQMGELSYFRTLESVTYENLTRPLQKAMVQDTVVVDAPKDQASARVVDTPKCKNKCGCYVQPGLDLSGRPYDTCCRTCAMNPGRKIKHDKDCRGRPEGQVVEKQQSGPTQLKPTTGVSAGAVSPSVAGLSPADGRAGGRQQKVKLPDIFRQKHPSEIFFQHYGCAPDPSWPQNIDVRWRLVTLARNLSLPIPRPFQAPFIPGLTVLIPHYGESILLSERELWLEESENVDLVDWLKRHWDDEFKNFHARKQANLDYEKWPATGNQWDEYTDEQWDALSVWSSMRMQTLWRTVAGMCLYHPALQLHYEAQAQKGSNKSMLASPLVWDPNDCFTCLVSMQMYKFFGDAELNETNRMLRKFPGCLKIAFIDSEEKGPNAQKDAVHERQRRRYFSCLIDRDAAGESRDEETGEEVGRRRPHYRIELPGYPILGDGKSDNQNHAIPFMRGTFSQCIDANQGAYFEQMLLLPCVLGEFRSLYRGDGGGKKIIGLPEHITSDIGSVGDMAASAELAFGSILQRTYAVLGARMHYGHPDIMNKQYMMQQGGVSKATKTLNLSEDIFAGMDFTLRGQGREIKHCEYFHLAKGRDLGFNTVLGFFSKLASGSGEQILTRQMFRIGQVFHLPEALSFHYAHVGYYLNQYLISWCLPCLMMVWLMVLLSDCDENFGSFQTCSYDYGDRPSSSAEIMSVVMAKYFSWVLLLFLVATSLPLFAEMWIERSFKMASARFLKQIFTLSPLLFIFQAKVIGHYIVNELRFGGATYVSTGRGLPTDRRWFIGEPKVKGFHMAKVGGLFLDYAQIAYYDGFFFLLLCILIPLVGGVKETATGPLVWLWASVALMITSWLFSPFIFNPYQFVWARFWDDCRAWCAFFCDKRGLDWVRWYEKTQLKPNAAHRFAVDTSLFFAMFLLLGWGELVLRKIDALSAIYSSAINDYEYVFILAPAVIASALFSFIAVSFERLLWLCSGWVFRLRNWLHPKESGTNGDDIAEDLEAADTRMEESRCCDGLIGMPIAIAAVFVCLLDFAEAFVAVYKLYNIGWYNAILAALILKFAMLTVLLRITESLLRARCFREPEDGAAKRKKAWEKPFVKAFLEFWLRSHRMWRDMMVSAFILIALVPWVFLNSLNDYLCRGCSIHKLLIYRDGGHFGRETLNFNLSQLQRTKSFATAFGGSRRSPLHLDLDSDSDISEKQSRPHTARSSRSIRSQRLAIRNGARVKLEWKGKLYEGTVHGLPDEDPDGQGRFKVHCDPDPANTFAMTRHVKLIEAPTLLASPLMPQKASSPQMKQKTPARRSNEDTLPERWEIYTDQGWMPFAPGVLFGGFAGEEVHYKFGSIEYTAKFDSETSGVQTNLKTFKQRALRRYDSEEHAKRENAQIQTVLGKGMPEIQEPTSASVLDSLNGETLNTAPLGESESRGSSSEVWDVSDSTHQALPPLPPTDTVLLPRLRVSSRSPMNAQSRCRASSSRSPTVSWDPNVVDAVADQPKQRRSISLWAQLDPSRTPRNEQSPAARSEPGAVV